MAILYNDIWAFRTEHLLVLPHQRKDGLYDENGVFDVFRIPVNQLHIATDKLDPKKLSKNGTLELPGTGYVYKLICVEKFVEELTSEMTNLFQSFGIKVNAAIYSDTAEKLKNEIIYIPPISK